jgi:hypothetical protein
VLKADDDVPKLDPKAFEAARALLACAFTCRLLMAELLDEGEGEGEGTRANIRR